MQLADFALRQGGVRIMLTITISGADKSGAMARISTLLMRKGYPLKGQQLMESHTGAKLVKISLEAAQVDRVKLAQELSSLSSDYRVVEVEGDQGTAALLKEMTVRFPDIAAQVQSYAAAFGIQSRNPELFEAGRKIGAFHFEKDWSFGTPLKMSAALRRCLVPALEKFGRVEASDALVMLAESPFLGRGKQINCCEFVTGFIQGFLDAGPLTANTLVHKGACRDKGDLHCAYALKYVL
jgi:predicted amino acid-binding ACT domain protein